MTPSAWTTTLSDDQATRALGAQVAQVVGEGEVLGLCGPLAAGKTTFCQGLARGLGVPEEVAVRSPTFTLCNEYSGRLPIFHLDLYRLGSEDEAEVLGFRERVGTVGVSVVEWADLFPDLFPLHTVWIQLEHLGARRQVTIWPGNSHLAAILPTLSLPNPGGHEPWTEQSRPMPWECSP
ncbi:MAG TPA: tRNA (adenosine(37)-N6)-threonylcarbamoyltransferase complex ATPase subunit type 1 TsaE [Deltaproteobacteria bacterium]|nr:tRNA (adenosine(37)-N6)-threonylcarbamoyltransferase complex ATPase subunit type 1 TsaE [Deltaproteobacteria bacterium]HCP46568.1 tRNA (adenosine(37)-N6)-threonylcarbamoyltransferase complex ATPase subunit type 1 TsaE [Deltaproteobacteria bacterium]